ncbi:MAG: extracellular solute-binding protein [Candidatus Paceibacterota bacterium]
MDSITTKPFQIILLAAFAFFAVVALILFANFGGFGGGKSSVGTVVIWGTLSQNAMGTSLEALKAADQQYNGVKYVQKQADTFDTDLAEALASGTGPDLVLISQEQLTHEQNKLSVIPFATISQRDYLNTFLPITELFLSTSGTYGIPFVVDPLVMYYNRTSLSNAGVASAPTSWEAVTGLAERMTVRQAGGVKSSVVPFGAYENVENSRAILSLLFLQAGNPIVTVGTNGLHSGLSDAGAGSSNSSPAVSATNFYTQFADPAKTVYTWNRALPSARQAFLSGDLAFYPGFASELPLLKAGNPNLDFDMAQIPQPQTSATRLTFARAYAFSVPRASKNATGAVAVAQVLATAPYETTAAQALSMAPALRSALTPSSNDRYQPVYYPQALVAKGWLSPLPTVTDQIFSTMIGDITSGRKDTTQALTAADQAINATF